MSDQLPLVRQWTLLRLLSSRHYGLSLREMAEELGVSQKTIRRDLQVFRECAFPLEEIVGQFGRKTWRIRPVQNQPDLSFTFDEAVALYLGRRFLEPLAGTLFWDGAQRAFKKIRACLNRKALKYLEKIAGAFQQTAVGASDYSEKADLIDDLMMGIEDNRAVFLTYQSLRATEPTTYDVYPFGLAYHRGSLYLIGWATDHKEIRHWKVDRIEKADVTKIHFNRPEGFNLQEHLSKSFGVYHGEGEVEVKVRFSPTVARYVTESTWHASQELTSQPDGTLLAEFELDGTEEIKHWILSFGRHAEVLEPTELRKEVAEEFAQSLKAYAESLPETLPKDHVSKRRDKRVLNAN